MIFSPLVQTSEESLGMPSENIHLVDKRLQLVYSDPSRAVELGLSPAPEGKINLVAQVVNLLPSHQLFIEELGGEVTSSLIGSMQYALQLTLVKSQQLLICRI